jgi:hypothetical protein
MRFSFLAQLGIAGLTFSTPLPSDSNLNPFDLSTSDSSCSNDTIVGRAPGGACAPSKYLDNNNIKTLVSTLASEVRRNAADGDFNAVPHLYVVASGGFDAVVMGHSRPRTSDMDVWTAGFRSFASKRTWADVHPRAAARAKSEDRSIPDQPFDLIPSNIYPAPTVRAITERTFANPRTLMQDLKTIVIDGKKVQAGVSIIMLDPKTQFIQKLHAATDTDGENWRKSKPYDVTDAAVFLKEVIGSRSSTVRVETILQWADDISLPLEKDSIMGALHQVNKAFQAEWGTLPIVRKSRSTLGTKPVKAKL